VSPAVRRPAEADAAAVRQLMRFAEEQPRRLGFEEISLIDERPG
jgi:hypothetical protein